MNITNQFPTLKTTSLAILTAISENWNLADIQPEELQIQSNHGDTFFDITIREYTFNFRFVLCSKACHVTQYNGQGHVIGCVTVGAVFKLWEANEIYCHKEHYTHGDDILTRLNHTQYCKFVVDKEKAAMS